MTFSNDYHGNDKLMVGNVKCLNITHTGSATLESTDRSLMLSNVLCVLKIQKSLISISKLTTENDVCVEFYPTTCFVKDKLTGKLLLEGKLKNGMYLLSEGKNASSSSSSYLFNKSYSQVGQSQLESVINSTASCNLVCSSKCFNSCNSSSNTKLCLVSFEASSRIWHIRLGHPNNKVLDSLSPIIKICKSFNSMNEMTLVCVACQYGKSHVLPFSIVEQKLHKL